MNNDFTGIGSATDKLVDDGVLFRHELVIPPMTIFILIALIGLSAVAFMITR